VRAGRALLFQDRVRGCGERFDFAEVLYLFEAQQSNVYWSGRGYYWRPDGTSCWTLLGPSAQHVRKRLRNMEIKAGVRPQPARPTAAEVLTVISSVVGIAGTARNLFTGND